MSIARHTMLNLAGAAVPLVVTVISVPLYLALIGVERFGLLSTCWMLLGFSSLFDLGLGRATAQQIARLSKQGSEQDRTAVFWTAHWLNLALGVGGGLIFLAAGPYLLGLLNASPTLERELSAAVPWLAAAVPISTIANVLSGALEGRERFGPINIINATGFSLMTLVPLIAAATYAVDLPTLIAASLAPRILTIALLYGACFKAVPLSGIKWLSRPLVRQLVTFGIWITLVSLAGPLLEYFNGFAVGAVLNAGLIASFSIPYSVCSRISLLPQSLSSALFPRFAASSGADENHAMQGVAVRVLSSVMTPLILVALLAGKPVFTLWLGRDIAEAAAAPLFILLGGFWAHAFIYVPYAKLQATGRPELVTKTRFAELIPYWALLIAALQLFGVAGAALVWALRAAIEPIILTWLTRPAINPLRSLVVPGVMVTASVAAGLALPQLGALSWLIMGLLAAAGTAWSVRTAPAELTDRIRLALRRPSPS